MVIANSAYGSLWAEDDGARLAGIGILEAIRGWQARTEPSPIWGRLRDFAGRTRDRGPWSGEVVTDDGRRLRSLDRTRVRGGKLCGLTRGGAITRRPPGIVENDARAKGVLGG